MIRVISLENEGSLIQLICEELSKDGGLEVKEVCKIDSKQGSRSRGKTAIDSFKRAWRRRDLHVKPALIDQDTVREVSKRDARKTWFFTRV